MFKLKLHPYSYYDLSLVIKYKVLCSAFLNTHVKSIKIMNKSSVLSQTPLVKAHPITGAIVTYFENSKGETFGKIRVDQRTPVVSPTGFMSFQNRSAFITMDEKTAKEMEPLLKEDTAYPLKGKVHVSESLEPFYPEQLPKTKGSDGDVITHNGQPVYRKVEFTQNLELEDILLVGDTEGVTTPIEPIEENVAE